MRTAKTLFLILLCLGLAAGQIFETIIPLPDSLGQLCGPYSVAWDDEGRFIYVGGENSEDIIVVDAVSLARVARIPTGERTRDLCYIPRHGKLYSTVPWEGRVQVVDCASRSVIATVTVGGRARELFYNPLNDRAYVANSNGTMTAIDCGTDSIVSRIWVGDSVRCFGFYPAENKLFVGTGVAGSGGPLTVVDCNRDTVIASLPDAEEASGLCLNPVTRKLYAACPAWQGNKIVVVDASADSVLAILPFADLTPALACDTIENMVFCSWGEGLFSRLGFIDGDADSLVGELWMGWARTMFLDQARRRLHYLAVDLILSVISTERRKVLSEISMRDELEGMRFSPELARAYGCTPYGYMTVVDLAGDTVIGRVPLAQSSEYPYLNPDENKLYVFGGRQNPYLTVIDLDRQQVVKRRDIPFHGGYCYIPTGRKYYVQRGGVGPPGVSVFDGAGDTVIGNVWGNPNVVYLTWHAGLDKVYAQSARHDVPDLTVINCGRDSVVAQVDIPVTYPWSYCLVPERNLLYLYLSDYHHLVIDCLTDRVIDTLENCRWAPLTTCYSLEDNKLYNGTNGGLYILDLASHEALDSIRIPPASHYRRGSSLIYVPNARKVYWALQPDVALPDSILVIDSRSDVVVKTLLDGHSIRSMCLDQTGNFVYCLSSSDGWLLVIDTRLDSIVARARLRYPGQQVLDRAATGSRLYVGTTLTVATGVWVFRDSIPPSAVDEDRSARVRPVRPGSIVHGVLRIPGSLDAELFDAAGRKVMTLVPGENDLRSLPLGVYFLDPRGTTAQQRLLMVK